MTSATERVRAALEDAAARIDRCYCCDETQMSPEVNADILLKAALPLVAEIAAEARREALEEAVRVVHREPTFSDDARHWQRRYVNAIQDLLYLAQPEPEEE